MKRSEALAFKCKGGKKPFIFAKQGPWKNPDGPTKNPNVDSIPTKIFVSLTVSMVTMLLAGCSTCERGSLTRADEIPQNVLTWLPYPHEIRTQSDLQDALQKRWTRERVLVYCKLNPPSDEAPTFYTEQSKTWKGKLWDDLGPDKVKVEWCAIVEKGIPVVYSVAASNDAHYWIIEYTGDPKLELKDPPYLVGIRLGLFPKGESYDRKTLFLSPEERERLVNEKAMAPRPR